MIDLGEDIDSIALSGYLGIRKTTKKEFDSYIQAANKFNAMLLDFSYGREVNLRLVCNQAVILFNMFDANTARRLLFHYSLPESSILVNTVLVYLSRSNDPNIDKELMEKLENG